MSHHLPYQQNRIFTLNEPNAPRLNPALACEIGLNESVILLQLEFWIAISNNEKDGMLWTYQSTRDMKITFPFWSHHTINRAIASLEAKKLIISTTKYNNFKYDKTRWFTLNFLALKKLESISIKGYATRSTQNETGSNQIATEPNHIETAPPIYPIDITRDSRPSARETTAENTSKTTTTTAYAAYTPIPETTSRSSLSYSINNFKEQNNILPVESSQAITNTSNNCFINKVENNCNLNDIQTELIALVPEKHKQPIVIKFINQTLKSGVNADTIKSSIIYTNTHSKGNIKQYRSYLGKTIENPNWHIGYLEQTELEQQLQQEIKNVAALKTNKNQEEPKKIDKGKEETEAFDNFIQTVDVEAFDNFIRTQCWDSMNSTMRGLWKEGRKYMVRRLNMQKFIDAQNGTVIVANPVLSATTQTTQSSAPAIATPFELPVQVQRPKNSLTSISFIIPELMQGIRPQPTA